MFKKNKQMFSKSCPCIEYFEDLPNNANYIIKYGKTVLKMLRIRFYMKDYIRNIHFELILLLKKINIIKYLYLTSIFTQLKRFRPTSSLKS